MGKALSGQKPEEAAQPVPNDCLPIALLLFL